MRRIESDDDVQAGLAALVIADSRLAPIVARVGAVPLRRRPAGFEGLARIVVAQQVSAAAATSIWERFATRIGGEVTASAIARFEDADLRAAGLSAAKVRTLRAMSSACEQGLDLDGASDEPAEAIIERLIEIKGIGAWTAEVYLLFSLGHPDVWPGGDLALRVAVGDALGLGERPDEKVVRAAAALWRPWRGVAARLFWAWYAVRRDGREGVVG